MAIILAPNPSYNGISAGIQFSKGRGQTTDPTLIAWFKNHGYIVEEQAPEEKAGEVENVFSIPAVAEQEAPEEAQQTAPGAEVPAPVKIPAIRVLTKMKRDALIDLARNVGVYLPDEIPDEFTRKMLIDLITAKPEK